VPQLLFVINCSRSVCAALFEHRKASPADCEYTVVENAIYNADTIYNADVMFTQ
jgi:hypothetical protein